MHGCTANDHCSELFFKSRGEKRLARFSFIRAEAFIPHPFGCNKRYESRLQFLMRTHSAAFTARCVIDNISGDAKKSCTGNFALSRSLQVARGTSFNARQGCRVVPLQNSCVFLQSKNTVVSGLSQKSVTFSTAYEFKIKSLYRNDLILNIA